MGVGHDCAAPQASDADPRIATVAAGGCRQLRMMPPLLSADERASVTAHTLDTIIGQIGDGRASLPTLRLARPTFTFGDQGERSAETRDISSTPSALDAKVGECAAYEAAPVLRPVSINAQDPQSASTTGDDPSSPSLPDIECTLDFVRIRYERVSAAAG